MTNQEKNPNITGEDPTSVVKKIQELMKSQKQSAQIPAAEPKKTGTPYNFAGTHIHIGIPCYGGMVSEPTMTSLLKFVLIASQLGVHWSLDTMVNESLIPRGRNNLMAKMMTNEKATHFMFIDADIRFSAENIFQMVAYEKDVIGGLYPKKTIPTSYVINMLPQTKIQGDIFTVDTLGTGFLLFKRNVYEKLIAAYPETKYVDDVGMGKQYEHMMYAIFDCKIDEKGHYLSEDWLFCRRWREIGGEIWAHSKTLLNHVGHYEYPGDLSKMPDFSNAKSMEQMQAEVEKLSSPNKKEETTESAKK